MSERGAGGGMPDAVGDNCRRASLLRCSCKEVLRRDKAPAITIEPRGNSLPTCHTHTHAHTRASALTAVAFERRVQRGAGFKERAYFFRERTDGCARVCVKKFAVVRRGRKEKKKDAGEKN